MFLKLLLILVIFGLLVLFVPRLVTGLYARSRTYNSDNVPARRVAIVFGAGLWRNGSPTPVLEDRVTTAANLYFAGKVEKLLLSGDNRVVDYNEPWAMRDLALSLGVPEDALVLDYAGRRTYDTCYRAKAIFGVTEAILVTQEFHLPRALYLCNRLGVSSVGVEADSRVYRKSSVLYWNMRELVATVAALWDVNISHPVPVLGDPLPIFPEKP
ncbi:MAG: ElyC/SanA/YdcF family protein [Chloroflexota bacterium]